jgi:lipopolysaccharide export system protein LptC
MSPAARERMLDGLRRRNPEVLARIARRSFTVAALKKALPAAAVLLLVALVMAPSWRAGPEANRVTYKLRSTGADNASHMQGAQYHGLDQHGQPFTLTADTADERGADVLALTSPAGDITLKDGAWLMLRSDHGTFHQKAQMLGLTGNVTLYRNDGTMMTAPSATIDLRAGSAASTAPVQVQGPFGTINAEHGFVLADRGAELTFNGPATMTLTQAQ